jgi:hypothetical protein
MKKLVSLAMCGLFSSMSFGQDSSKAVSRNKYIQFDIGLGYLHTNMTSVNATFKNAGLNPMKNDYATLSVSGSYFFNRFLFRTEASLVLPNSVHQGNHLNTEFTGYTIGASVGYAVIQNPRFRLYPYIGITNYNTALKFNDLSPAGSLSDLLNNPRQNTKIKYSNAALDLGAQLERIIALKNNQWDCAQYNKYMTLGLRAGYNWSPNGIKARYNGEQISGAPEYNFQGPYVKLVVGFGRKVRQLKWQ